MHLSLRLESKKYSEYIYLINNKIREQFQQY